MTNRKQQVTGYQYDDLDRLSVVTFQDSSTITYTYDAGDRLTQIADSLNGNITRGYDNFDRLTSETTPQGSISYTCDADGRRVTMTVAGQPQVTYGYDDAHRLTSITQSTSVVSITYDNADRRNTLTYPNGIVATYGYDNANQLTSLAYTLNSNPVGDLTYTYDLAGQRISVGGSWGRTGLPQALTAATYDAENRLLTWGSQVFSYDPNGNLGSDGPTSYVWNTRDQLTALSGEMSASFQYDGVGRRRGKTISGATTQFLYDGPNFVQELSGGGAVTANLLTGLHIDETFTRTDAAGVRNLLTDALGSTLTLTDSGAAVQTQYTYEPFGRTSLSGAANPSSTQFAGRETDFTDLYSFRARFYNTGLQRFISEDPLSFASGEFNLFAYAFNAPTEFSDPTGAAVFVAPPGTFPSCEKLGGRKDLTWWDQLWCGLDLGQMLPGPGTIVAPGFTADQDALLQLAKEARKLGGVSEDAANTLLEWAKELGLRTSEGIEMHPGRNFNIPHIRIGPVNHIPVR